MMEQSVQTPAPVPGARPVRPPAATRVTWWFVAVLFGIHAVMAVAQPFLAGAFLNGDADAIGAHAAVGGSLTLVDYPLVLVAVLFWRPGHGPGWPVLVTALLLVAEHAQVALGATHQLGLHIPLGVGIVGAAVALFVWSISWRVRLGRRYRAGGAGA